MRYLEDSRVYNEVVNHAGRLEIILTSKFYRAPFTITISDSEDWNVILRTIKRWETENYTQFLVKFIHKFEGITLSTKITRLQPRAIDLDDTIPLSSTNPS